MWRWWTPRPLTTPPQRAAAPRRPPPLLVASRQRPESRRAAALPSSQPRPRGGSAAVLLHAAAQAPCAGAAATHGHCTRNAACNAPGGRWRCKLLPAACPPACRPQRSREAIDLGLEKFQQGDYAGAIELFELALELPGSGVMRMAGGRRAAGAACSWGGHVPCCMCTASHCAPVLLAPSMHGWRRPNISPTTAQSRCPASPRPPTLPCLCRQRARVLLPQPRRGERGAVQHGLRLRTHGAAQPGADVHRGAAGERV